jgi:hypothetical protein
MVLAQAAVTLVVLGALSGTARAEVGDSSGAVAPDERAVPHHVRIRPPGQVGKAGAETDGAATRVDISVTALQASVSVDEGSISLSVERIPVVGKHDDSPSPDRPDDAPQATAAGEHGDPDLASGPAARRTGWSRDGGPSITGADDENDGAMQTRHPLGPPLGVLTGSGSEPATTSAEDRPDVFGVLAHLSFHRDTAGRPFESAIAVFAFDLVPSTGPPG